MIGYKAGDTPPGLMEDGSFDTGLGVRAYSIIDEEGKILVVNQATGTLIEEPEETT